MASLNKSSLTYNNFVKDSILPSSQTTGAYTGELLKQDIEFLNKKIESARKTLTQWDFYKISDVVTDKTSLKSQINTLLPNTALVINTSSFYDEDVRYSRGDIVYKKTDYTTEHIKAENSGIYYPYRIIAETNSSGTATGNYTLEYKYAAAIPENAQSVTVEAGSVVTTPSNTIGFKKLTTSTPNNAYGLEIDIIAGSTSSSFTSAGYNSKKVRPLIKFLSKNGEIIESSYQLTLNENTWTVSNIPSVAVKMQVR